MKRFVLGLALAVFALLAFQSNIGAQSGTIYDAGSAIYKKDVYTSGTVKTTGVDTSGAIPFWLQDCKTTLWAYATPKGVSDSFSVRTYVDLSPDSTLTFMAWVLFDSITTIAGDSAEPNLARKALITGANGQAIYYRLRTTGLGGNDSCTVKYMQVSERCKP